MRVLVAAVIVGAMVLVGVSLWQPEPDLTGGVEKLAELPDAWRSAIDEERWADLYRLLHPDDRPSLLASVVFDEPGDRDGNDIPAAATAYAAMRQRHGVRWTAQQWTGRGRPREGDTPRQVAVRALGPVEDPATLFADAFALFLAHQPSYVAVLRRAPEGFDEAALIRLGENEARMPDHAGAGLNWFGRVDERWFMRMLSGVDVWHGGGGR